jgi:transposase
MKGRKLGTIEVSLQEIQQIVNMTEAKQFSRKEIANAVSRSSDTVYRYQKKFDLI